jgi:diaminohydroxyphosphoribosylaminopyrimidine deaminase/5-amino-6-(5-phosphoribosylamino)uracil reductase
LFSSAANDNVKFMDLAISHAKKGLGRTFPNPAVGCVLVRQDTNDVIGAGFHPRAGMPHAEVFALLEASGHVPNGVDAAMSIINQGDNDLMKIVQDLTQQYVEDGPQALFGGALSSVPVTAYVTLEPCCHVGKTPPCANSLVVSQVDRVVVGFRDPNPRVDGGGVTLLQEAGIAVDVLEGNQQADECAQLVTNFVKRITPRDYDYEHVNGAQRRALRSLAARHKTSNTLAVQPWPSAGPSLTVSTDRDLMAAVDALPLDPSWVETVDASLWENELVQLKLGNAVAKKKGAKRLGERVAQELNAHVAQVVGHTVLLYRPGIPPVLDLPTLVKEQRTKED